MLALMLLFILFLGLVYYWSPDLIARRNQRNRLRDEGQLEDKFEQYIYTTLRTELLPFDHDDSSGSDGSSDLSLKDWLQQNSVEELSLNYSSDSGNLDRSIQLGSNQGLFVFGLNHHITLESNWLVVLSWPNHQKRISPPNRNSVFWYLPISTWPERGGLRIPEQTPLTIQHHVYTQLPILRPRVFRFTSTFGQDRFEPQESRFEPQESHFEPQESRFESTQGFDHTLDESLSTSEGS